MEATNEPVENELVPVPDFPGYFVTRNGQVWSKKRRDQRKLEPYTVGGYKVSRFSQIVFVQRYIHEVLLTSLVGPCPPGSRAVFLDGDRTNLKIDNLAWQPFSNGLTYSLRELTREDVRLIRESAAQGEVLTSLAFRFGVSQAEILSIIAHRKV